MKQNTLFYLAGFILIFLLSIGFHSCKKEAFQLKEQERNVKDKHVEKMIKKFEIFRFQMNSNFKAGDLMHIDSTVWYIEALTCFDNAYPDSSSRDFAIINTYYTLDVDLDSMADLRDVQVLYDQIEDSLYYYLDLIDEEVKFIAFADVQLNSVENNVANIQMISGYGSGYVLGYYEPFAPDDDWIWGTLGENPSYPPRGKCDGTQFGVSDGSNELQRRFNNPYPQPPGQIFYTNYETKSVIGWYDNNGYIMHWDASHYLDYCLLNEVLTHYLIKGHEIIYTFDDPNVAMDGARPYGKDFISIYIEDQIWPNGTSDYPYVHHYYITYAEPSGGPPQN